MTSFPNNTSAGPNTVLTRDVVPQSTGTVDVTGNFTRLVAAKGGFAYYTDNYTNGLNRLCTFTPPITSFGPPVTAANIYCVFNYSNNLTLQITNISLSLPYDSFFQNNTTTQSILNLTTFANGTKENITNGTLSDINTTNYTAVGGSASSALFIRFKSNNTNFTERINLDNFVGFNRSFVYPNGTNLSIIENLANGNTSIVTNFTFPNGTNLTNVTNAPAATDSNTVVNSYVTFFRSPNTTGNFNYTVIQYNGAAVTGATPVPANLTLENKTIYNNGTTNFSIRNPAPGTATAPFNLSVLQIPRIGQTNPDNYTFLSICSGANLTVVQQPGVRTEILNNTRSPGSNYQRIVRFTAVDGTGAVTTGTAEVKIRYFNGTLAEWNTTITSGQNSTTGFFLKPNTTVVGGTPIRENFGPSSTEPSADNSADNDQTTNVYGQVC